MWSLYTTHVANARTRYCMLTTDGQNTPCCAPLGTGGGGNGTAATTIAKTGVSWNFDSSCSTGSSSCATKLANKHCGDDDQQLPGSYSSWSAAKAACVAAGSRCFGVYDGSCDKSGDIKLCDTSSIRTSSDLASSSSGSCVFEKPAGVQSETSGA